MERTCGQCKKKIGGIEPAQCSYCEQFFHVNQPECSELTRNLMQQLFSNGKALWFCPKCRALFANRSLKSFLSEKDVRVEPRPSDELVDLKSQIQTLTEVVMDLKSEVERMRSANAADLYPPLSASGPAKKRKSRRPYYSQVASSSDLANTDGSMNETDDTRTFVSPPPATICSTKEIDLSDLSVSVAADSAPQRFWLYLIGLNPRLTNADVNLIITRCLETDGNFEAVRLVAKGVDTTAYRFVSYKVGLDPDLKGKALDGSTWPKDVRVREFIDYGAKNSPAAPLIANE